MKLFKIRTTQVPAEEEGRYIIRTELMIFVQCKFSDAHHAIYRELNQKVETRLRLSAYVFDVRGCKYPDRTMSSLPINVQQIRDRLQVNSSITDPIYIDFKNDRARVEDRQHRSKKIKGDYPVERVTGKADVPTYKKTRATQSVLSTLNGPPGLLIGERNQAMVTPSISSTVKKPSVSSLSEIPEIPSTLNGPPCLLIGERDSSTKAPMKTQSNIRRLTSSAVIGSKASSESCVPNTLNGPPGLLIGERSNESQKRLFPQTTSVPAVQSG